MMKRTLFLVAVVATVTTVANLSAIANTSARQLAPQASIVGNAQMSPLAAGAQNVLIVSPSGGNFTSVQAALSSITTNSARNRFLIWVGPGTYYEQITMKPYVDIEGAGEGVTKISSIGSTSIFTGTVVGASNAELRFLTVENTGGSSMAIGILNDGTSPNLQHLRVLVTGSSSNTSLGVSSANAASPEMSHVSIAVSGGAQQSVGVGNGGQGTSPVLTDVTIVASGNGAVMGVSNSTYSSPLLSDMTITVAGGVNNTIGVWNSSSSPAMADIAIKASSTSGDAHGVFNYASSPTMNNVTATASGPATNYGIRNNALSSPTMNNVTATASGGTTSLGIANIGSAPEMNFVKATGKGAPNSYGVFTAGATFTLSNSTLKGDTAGLYIPDWDTSTTVVSVQNSQLTGTQFTAYSPASVTLAIGASYLNGGRVAGAGPKACAGVYDENYTFYPSACP